MSSSQRAAGGGFSSSSALRAAWAAELMPTTTLATAGCAAAKWIAAAGKVESWTWRTSAISRARRTSAAGAGW